MFLLPMMIRSSSIKVDYSPTEKKRKKIATAKITMSGIAENCLKNMMPLFSFKENAISCFSGQNSVWHG